MATFTLEHLKAILLACSGQPYDGTLDGDVIDTPLRDLGYDSLAVLEVASAIQREFGFAVPDEAIELMETSRAILDYVNAELLELAG